MDNDFNNANNTNANWHNDTLTIPVEELQRAQESIQNSYGFEVQPTAYDYNGNGMNYSNNYGNSYNDGAPYQQPAYNNFPPVQDYQQTGAAAKGNGGNNNKVLIIVFAVIIAVILIAGGIVAAVLIGNSGDDGNDNGTSTSKTIKVKDYTVPEDRYYNDSVIQDIRDNQGYDGEIEVVIVGADEFTDEMRDKGYVDGIVTWQSEKPGTKIKGDSFKMELRIAAGEKTEYGKMPYLYGVSEADVKRRMDEVGITDYKIEYEKNSKFKSGLVCRQNCAPYYHPDEQVIITVAE